jgi:hypothetical protein
MMRRPDTGVELMEKVVFAAGLLHLCQVPSMFAAPRMLGWKQDLARLEPINRRIVQVIGAAIMIVVIGLGIVVMAAPGELLTTRLGAALACFLGVFWLYRAVVQVVLYRRIWPHGRLGRASHYALSLLFFALTAAYFAAFAVNVTR